MPPADTVTGFSDPSQPGGSMVFQIAREPAGCVQAKRVLSLMAYTNSSAKVKGQVDASFAQEIAAYVPNGAGRSNLASDATKLGRQGAAFRFGRCSLSLGYRRTYRIQSKVP